MGEISHYVGIQREHFIFPNQSTKIVKPLEGIGLLDAKLIATPMNMKFFAALREDIMKLQKNRLYRKVMELFLYIVIVSRPDIAVGVSLLPRRGKHPTQADSNETK